VLIYTIDIQHNGMARIKKKVCNWHCICQFSWQSEGFATQKHDGSSNSYFFIAKEVVVWVLSHTETFIALRCTDAYVKLDVLHLCVPYYILHYQNPEFFLGYCIWHTAVINWIWDDPPPFSGRHLYETYLSLWTVIKHP
jgi:hypothetical protein